jgi:hypothetical protein
MEMNRYDRKAIDLLRLLVPELKAKVPADTLIVRQKADGTGIGSIFMSPPSVTRYATGWRQHWHRQVTLADIDWLVASGYMRPIGNDTYRLNAEAILKVCEARE